MSKNDKVIPKTTTMQPYFLNVIVSALLHYFFFCLNISGLILPLISLISNREVKVLPLWLYLNYYAVTLLKHYKSCNLIHPVKMFRMFFLYRCHQVCNESRIARMKVHETSARFV